MLKISHYISLATTNTNREIIIDPEDLELVQKYSWMEHIQGYAVSTTKPTVLLHRLIMSSTSAPLIDHINQNKLDNRKCNLRGCTNSQNQMNRQAVLNTSSKYKGVSLRVENNRWCAEIYKDNKRYKLGNHATEEKAALAYNKKATELHGDFARLNIVEG